MRQRLRPAWDGAPSPWLVVAAIPLALLVVVWACVAVPPKPRPEELDWYLDTPRLDQFEKSVKPRVMVLGTSLVAHGLAFDGAMEALAAQRGQQIRFIRFARNGRQLDWLLSVLRRVQGDPPDFLVVEAELAHWGEQQGKGLNAQERRTRVFSWLLWEGDRLLFNGKPGWIRDGLNQAPPLDGGVLPPPSRFDSRTYSKVLATFRQRSPDETAELITLLHSIQGKGGKVVLYSMGRSPEAAALFPADMDTGFNSFLDRAAAQGFIVDRSCLLPQEYYLDAAHLNSAGMKLASEHFIGRIGPWRRAIP